MARYHDRQLLRAMGWRGTKAKRARSYPRPDLAPYDSQRDSLIATRQATTTTQE